MLLSELKTVDSKYNPQLKGQIQTTQICKIKCDNCGKEFEKSYVYFIKGRKNYNNKDLCRSCMQIEQNKQGLRKEQYIKAGEGFNKKYKGKILEEIIGEERAKEFRKKISERTKGSNNPNFGGKYCKGFGHTKGQPSIKGKKYEELYGNEKSKKLKENLSIKFSGKNAPNYGKPAPQGSGNGWSGWYKDWYFRSLLELSFMINYIEKQNIQWDTGERAKYNIPYINWEGKDRSYFSDFILENNRMVEIKPTNLRNSKDVLLKEQAAIEWCKEHNFTYEIVESSVFPKLTKEEITELHDSGQIKFIDRYEEKYKKWMKDVKNSKVN